MRKIEQGHNHFFVTWDDFTRPSGVRMVWARCVCGLEERRYFRDGEPIQAEYRFGGIWMHPLDLLRVAPLRMIECPACHGDPNPLQASCATCLDLGVVEPDGARVRLTPAAVVDESTWVQDEEAAS